MDSEITSGAQYCAPETGRACARMAATGPGNASSQGPGALNGIQLEDLRPRRCTLGDPA